MNFRRRTPRHKGRAAREHSSDYRYIRVEKGNPQRSRPSVRRWVERARQTLIEWKWLR